MRESDQPDRNTTLREKGLCVMNVLSGVINEILAQKEFTQATALDLANRYYSYSSEQLLYNEDETRSGVQEGPITQDIADRFYERRVGTETSLDIAHFLGDYRPLKTVLTQEGQGLISLSETEKRVSELTIANSMRAHGLTRNEAKEIDRRTTQRDRHLGEQFLEMARIIPDNGDPLIPPPPAGEI